MALLQDKASSTGAGMSRQNSLSSLPETECDWPHLEAPAPLHGGGHSPMVMPEQYEAVCPDAWQPFAAPCTAAPLQLPTLGLGLPGVSGTMVAPESFFQVAFLGGIEVRAGPDFDAPRTGLVMVQGEVFAVSQQFHSTDGRKYLCLADGRGWVFDDAALVPHDPSVVQLLYTVPQAHYETQGAHMPPPWAMSEAGVPPQPTLAQAFVPMMLPPPSPPMPPPLHPAPQGELLASTPACAGAGPACASSAPDVIWYRVSYLGGVSLRTAPSVDAPTTGFILAQMETFPVAEELPGSDGRVYLRLCDGRGWAFDDSALMPHDPSVKRGSWMPNQQTMHTRVFQEVQGDALSMRRRHPQPRGKRGGKRCSRRSQATVARVGAVVQG